MTREQLEEIFNGKESFNPEGDNVFQGLVILKKYFPEDCFSVEAAEHDIIYSYDVDRVVAANITEEDAHALNSLRWFIDEDNDCLAHFV